VADVARHWPSMEWSQSVCVWCRTMLASTANVGRSTFAVDGQRWLQWEHYLSLLAQFVVQSWLQCVLLVDVKQQLYFQKNSTTQSKHWRLSHTGWVYTNHAFLKKIFNGISLNKNAFENLYATQPNFLTLQLIWTLLKQEAQQMPR